MAIKKHSLEKAGKIAVDGGEVGYRYYVPHNEKFKNRAPLVLVHGGPGGSHIGMYDALHDIADSRPILGYDQLGSYLSPAKMSADLMAVERFAQEPLHLLDALGIEKAVLLGHSWGGVIIGEFALNHPDRVAGLIFSAPLISTQRWVEDCNKLLAQLPPEMQKTIRECEKNGTTDSPEYQAADTFFGKRHFSRAARTPSAVIANGKRSNRELYNAMWGPSEFTHSGTLSDVDLFPRLKNITAPTQIICGEYDTATPSYMKEVQGQITGAQLYVVPNAGHAVISDGNKDYIRTVKGFLSNKIDMKTASKIMPPKP